MLPSAAAGIQEEGDFIMIRGIIATVLIFFIATFPATWLLMLFFGNVGPGLGLSYWGTLPLGIIVSLLLAGVSGPRTFNEIVT
jgi:hypothetical protein